jgi:zinc D-Ala-D-Ala carboxypeptidase
MNQKAATMNTHGKEAMHLHSNADIKVEATNLYEKTSGSMYSQAGGEINIKAADNTNIEGSELHWNSGTASDSVGSVIAGSSNIGVISGRKDITSNDKTDPLVLSLADSRSIALEEETQTVDDYNNQKNLIISEGFATAADIGSAPVAVDSTTVESEQSNFVAPDAKLKTVTELPGNYKLSPNFTVEMLSSKAAVSRDPIRGHVSASYGDIVYNLQAVALNVLEPVKKLYPNMFVTSAFRDPGNSSNAKTSQHPLGQGVDIQFKGVSKQEYYDIAAKLAKVISYDQLILEYCNYTNNPWIHISYSVNNRSKVLTFFNHKKHSDGLTQLA